MTHDPFQTLSMLGAYSGAATPFGTPYAGAQIPSINPAAIHPLAATLGISSPFAGAGVSQFGQWGYPGAQPYGGINPQQLQQQQQLAQALLAQTLNPQLQGQSPANWQNPQQGIQHNPLLQNPVLQNPYVAAAVMQNPLVQAVLQNPQLAQHLALQQIQSQFAQTGSPYGQIGGGLAPQSWVGQGASYAGGQPFGQVHPLIAQQLAARALHATGISPWAGF